MKPIINLTSTASHSTQSEM